MPSELVPLEGRLENTALGVSLVARCCVWPDVKKGKK